MNRSSVQFRPVALPLLQGLPPVVFMSHDGIGTEATIDRNSVEGMAQGPIGEIRANAVEPSGGDVRYGEEQSFASRSGGATGGGRRILPRGNDTLVDTLKSADSNRLRVLGISEEQRQKVQWPYPSQTPPVIYSRGCRNTSFKFRSNSTFLAAV